MSKNKSFFTILFFALLFLSSGSSLFGQSKKQRQLEAKRQEILKEIIEINTILKDNKSETSSLLSTIEELRLKIKAQQRLIQITNQQANLLTRSIKQNHDKITVLESDLVQLKKAYATMVVTSYKNKSHQSKLLFLLSSEDFLQAYKRYNYMKQYKRFQKKQADSIVSKTEKLANLNKELLLKKDTKAKLIVANTIVQKKLQDERESQRLFIATLKQDEKKYKKEIAKKQRETAKIDKQIEKLIKEAIALANKKAKKKRGSTTFALTPEAKALAANFTANKGRLPWPVKAGHVVQKFGKQRHPTLPGIYTQSSGVKIITTKNSTVSSVFNGVVSRVQLIKGGNQTVLVRHGNYLTVYSNLKQLKVKKGDKVATGSILGRAATNSDGKSIIRFFIYKNNTKLNPALWVYKM